MRVRLLTFIFTVVNISVQAQTLWPKNENGTVTIPYFFDDNTLSKGDTRRTTFLEAVEVYKKSTCIEWVQVARNETPGHVRVKSDKKWCSSYTGMIYWGTNNISLATWCNKLGKVLHEMAHASGMAHTHQRPDRDAYVEIWKHNIEKEARHNYDIRTSYETQGLPYDYLSLMHYTNSFFSDNGLYTITPKNRLALFAMGSNRIAFRWSDTAWINKAYDCESFFLKTCPKLDCKNGGYVGKDCKCNCPENTKGTLCERKTGDLFNEDMNPRCGGIVRREREISTYGVKACVYQIIAPQCRIPQINITKATFRTTFCNRNRLILHVSKTSFGHVYCDRYKIPVGHPVLSDSSEAAIYYTAFPGTNPSFGFTFSITFIKNTTWPGVIPTQQTTIASSPAVTLEGPCDLMESENGSFIYSTPNFPSQVACYAECSADFKTAQSSSLVLYEVSIQKEFERDERLFLRDSVWNHIISGSKPNLMPVVMWPFKLKFSGSDHPGNGFRITLTPAKRVVHPCGEVLTLSVNEMKTVTNPLFNTAHTIKTCIFKIEAEREHRIECSVTNLGKTILPINTNFPKLQFSNAVEKTYESIENHIHFYYLMGKIKTDWSITCKAVPK